LAPTRKQIFETAPTRSNLIAPHILKSLWNTVTKHDEIGSCGEYRTNVSGLARWLSVILSIRPRDYAGQLVNITKLSEKAE